MAATIAHFAPRVEALAARLPTLLDAEGRARVGAAVAEYVGKGVPEALAARAVTLDALYLTLDIVEVAGATHRPVELVAEIYFELSTRLELPWFRAMIARLPGDAHWQMLAQDRDGRRPVGTAARHRRRSADGRRRHLDAGRIAGRRGRSATGAPSSARGG